MSDEVTIETLKASVDELNTTVVSYRRENEALTAANKTNSEQLEELVKNVATKDEAINKFHRREESYEAMKKQLDELQIALKRPGVEGKTQAQIEQAEKDIKYREAFLSYIRRGEASLSSEHTEILEAYKREEGPMSTGEDTAGGYLVNPELLMGITKEIIEVSPIRQYADVKMTRSNAIRKARRVGVPAAQWVDEMEKDQKRVRAAYGMHRIPVHPLRATVGVHNDTLMDSEYDLESEVRMDVSEQFATSEGLAFLKGNGVAQPFGIMVTPGIAEVKSGIADNIDDDAIVDMAHGIKSGYWMNARWTMNRKTMASVYKLKQDNRYIWTPAFGDRPSMLLGYPYFESHDMDDVGANKYPLLFGNFMRGYCLVTRIGMTTLRDPYTQKDQDITEFQFKQRVGGQVVLTEAFVKMKCAV